MREGRRERFQGLCSGIIVNLFPLSVLFVQLCCSEALLRAYHSLQHRSNTTVSVLSFSMLSSHSVQCLFHSHHSLKQRLSSLSVCVSPLSELSQLVAPSQSPPPALTSIPYIYCSVYYLLYESNSLLFFLYFDIYVVLYTESIESMGRRKP